MSAKKAKQRNLFKALEIMQLTRRERVVVSLFRQLDKQGRNDIIRFLDALLAHK